MMSERGPAEEHVLLSAHEQREFTLIHQRWADNDPTWPQETECVPAGASSSPAGWVAGMVCSLSAVLGLVMGWSVLILLGFLGIFGMSVAYVCRNSEHVDPRLWPR